MGENKPIDMVSAIRAVLAFTPVFIPIPPLQQQIACSASVRGRTFLADEMQQQTGQRALTDPPRCVATTSRRVGGSGSGACLSLAACAIQGRFMLEGEGTCRDITSIG